MEKGEEKREGHRKKGLRKEKLRAGVMDKKPEIRAGGGSLFWIEAGSRRKKGEQVSDGGANKRPP